MTIFVYIYKIIYISIQIDKFKCNKLLNILDCGIIGLEKYAIHLIHQIMQMLRLFFVLFCFFCE